MNITIIIISSHRGRYQNRNNCTRVEGEDGKIREIVTAARSQLHIIIEPCILCVFSREHLRIIISSVAEEQPHPTQGAIMRHHTTHGGNWKRQNNDNKSSKEAQWQKRLTLIGVCSAICIRLKMQTLYVSIQLIMIRRFIPILGHTLCSFRKDTIDFHTHTGLILHFIFYTLFGPCLFFYSLHSHTALYI